MKRRSLSAWLLLLPAISGCASMDCCNWFGRNTDGSTNMGNKPTPVQAGPIASTYVRPGAGTITPTATGSGTTTPQVIISSPAQPAPTMPAGSMPPSPTLTPPPAMPSAPSAPGALQSQGSFLQLPSAELTGMNDGAMPAPPSISAPTVNTRSIDLNVPGGTSSAPVQATPMLLVPVTSQSPGAGASLQAPPPVIEMPAVAAPQINAPVIQTAPKATGAGSQVGMNPGSMPPPLPPPPAIPVLGGK